jgi:NAD(P)H dehydrogenase (quinone)
VDAAAAVGVKRIIYISGIGATADSIFTLAPDHYYTEEHIRALGVPFVFLRMGLYTDQLPHYPAADGVIRGPAGEGRVAFVTRDDVADTAVAVLTGHGHDGLAYDITGPESLSMADVAERLSAVAGRKITYQSITPHEARTRRNISYMMERVEAELRAATGKGLTDSQVEVFVTHFLQMAAGESAAVSDTVLRLTGHPAQSLADFLKAHPQSYQHLIPSI